LEQLFQHARLGYQNLFLKGSLYLAMVILKKLYVKCPNCEETFPSGFEAESPTQLISFSYLCPKCRSIFPCFSPEYLEKANGEFQKAMTREEILALPLGQRVEISGPGVFELNKEVIVKPGTFLSSDRAIIRYNPKDE
jgi:hypothetical protein